MFGKHLLSYTIIYMSSHVIISVTPKMYSNDECSYTMQRKTDIIMFVSYVDYVVYH